MWIQVLTERSKKGKTRNSEIISQNAEQDRAITLYLRKGHIIIDRPLTSITAWKNNMKENRKENEHMNCNN